MEIPQAFVGDSCCTAAIWVTWERQRRNASMARAVNAQLYELEHRTGTWARYPVLALRTLWLVLRRRSKVIFFQNPSIVLATLLVLLRELRIFRGRLIGDFHNAGVFPPWGRFLVPWIVRRSDLIIVSNEHLEREVERLGGRAISVPDPIPSLDRVAEPLPLAGGQFRIFMVCSWAEDEPIVEVLRAAKELKRLAPGVVLSISGRPKLKTIGWSAPVPDNVQLTGFLSEEDYESQLLTSAIVLDLTTRSDCMVCGAYEAVSAGVPVILSDNEPSRRYFYQGVIFTDNSANSIVSSIMKAIAEHERLRVEMSHLKVEIMEAETGLHERLRELAYAGPQPSRSLEG